LKVTIITVAFNSAATIADTLRSVAAQTHSDIEHIVVDGASKDNTAAIVQHEGGHVTRFVSEPDRGIYDAMNKGISMATGDWIGFLNADDVFASPQSLSCISAAVSQGGCDIAYGDLVYVSARDTSKVLRTWSSGPFDPCSLHFGWMPPHPTFYVRRELMGEIGGFDAALEIAADYEFMLRCLTRRGVRVVYVPEVLVRMRAGGASNRSLGALWRKSREDLVAVRRHKVGGFGTLAWKNLRKLPQFLGR
jgi:glycosyltransferase